VLEPVAEGGVERSMRRSVMHSSGSRRSAPCPS
jgi:hypothetical protein